MKRFKKLLLSIGIIFSVIILLITSLGVWFVRRPWSQTNGKLSLPGLIEPVKIIRDQWGVPQIYAENEHDLFFAQGYVHAQDRLWQMEFNRRTASGRLSEILGKGSIETDRRFRYYGLRKIAEESWDKLDAETKTILDAYTQGINAYLDTHRNALPVEFTLVGDNPEYWTPVDVMIWGPMIAYITGFNHSYEIFRAELVVKLGEEAAKQLLPPFGENTPFILPPETQGYEWMRGVSYKMDNTIDYLGDTTFWGSAAWVIDGKHSATGKPLIANDPHLPTWMPPQWYEIGLHGGRFDVVGFGFPGVPLVASGHNQEIAWALASLHPDVQDLYIEKLDDPKNPTQYEYMGEWLPLEVRQETIQVKGSDPIVVDVYSTRHGPIINQAIHLPDTTEPLAFRWAVADGCISMASILKLNLATNWDEFRIALAEWDTLSQNFLYADMEGNIGMQSAGKIPVRQANHLGIVPVPGWTGEYEWEGYIPAEELPSSYNPAKGFIVTANNRISADYPRFLTYDWYEPGYRAIRITEMITSQLATGSLLSMEDMSAIQADTYSYPAQLLMPRLLAAIQPETELEKQAIEILQNWDLRDDLDSVGATLYETWYSYFADNTVNDEFNQHEINITSYLTLKKGTAMVNFMADPNNAWFDNVASPQVETRDDIVRQSFRDSLAWLQKNFGDNPGQWQWGQVHQVVFTHTPFNQAGPILSRIFNTKAYPMQGSEFTSNLTYMGRGEKSFGIWAAANQRMMIDLNNWDNMWDVSSTGQSGQLFHPHREDQTPVWQNMGYHITPFSLEAIQAQATDVLELLPAK